MLSALLATTLEVSGNLTLTGGREPCHLSIGTIDMTTLRPNREPFTSQMPGVDESMDTYPAGSPRWLVARIRHRVGIASAAELLIALWIAITMLVGLPVAAVVGFEVYESRSHFYSQQAETRQMVTAVVTSDNAMHQELSDPRLVSVPAQWFAAGVQHAGEVTAPRGVKAGESVDIWVDRDGNHVGLPYRTVLDEAAAAALSTWLSVTIVAAIFLAGNWAVVQRFRDSRSEGAVLRTQGVMRNQESNYGGV
jgi:hypothetical protein